MRIPILTTTSPDKSEEDAEMEVDNQSHGLWSAERIEEHDVRIDSDGLLLYVGEAAYEPGESPLSVWVPRKSPEEFREAAAEASGQLQSINLPVAIQSTPESPLDCFER